MNENQTNKPSQEESLKPKSGETKHQPSTWNKMLSRRWVFPAVYTAAAAIILTLVWVYQDAGTQTPKTDTAAVVSQDVGGMQSGSADVKTPDQDAAPVVASAENLAWPVASPGEIEVVKPYYDQNGTDENHVQAMVQSGDTFMTNNGIDLARKDNQEFDVKAALSGKVTRVEDVPVLGNVIEVTHDGNLKTVYQSVGEAKVKVGDEVKQGETLAAAGRNELEKDLGNHLHFEVYENGKVVNPADLLPQK